MQICKDGNKVNINKLDWKSKGYKQRTHRAYIKDGNVYLTLNKDSHAVESDIYNN